MGGKGIPDPDGPPLIALENHQGGEYTTTASADMDELQISLRMRGPPLP